MAWPWRRVVPRHTGPSDRRQSTYCYMCVPIYTRSLSISHTHTNTQTRYHNYTLTQAEKEEEEKNAVIVKEIKQKQPWARTQRSVLNRKKHFSLHILLLRACVRMGVFAVGRKLYWQNEKQIFLACPTLANCCFITVLNLTICFRRKWVRIHFHRTIRIQGTISIHKRKCTPHTDTHTYTHREPIHRRRIC